MLYAQKKKNETRFHHMFSFNSRSQFLIQGNFKTNSSKRVSLFSDWKRIEIIFSCSRVDRVKYSQLHNHRGTAFHYSQYREIFMGIHRRTKVITAIPWIFSRLSLSRDISLTSVLSHLCFYLSHFVPFTFPLITS